MHPPLDRPHPMCQTQINKLKECHAKTSKLKFWGCNTIKFEMDKCLKQEKLKLVSQLNENFDEKRKREDDAFQDAMGYNQSFEEFLKTDKVYLEEMRKMKMNEKTK
jgi:COX assembly protein 2